MIKNPVLGAIAGDMIGVPYEFLRHGVNIAPDFQLWSDNSTFSDDTVMTLAVAKWLVDDPLNTSSLVKIMQDLGRRHRNRGYGSNFGAWLDSEDPQPYGSWGNGSAMRVSPVGCAFRTLDTTLEVAEQSAAVSHNDPEGIKGAQCIAEYIWYYLNGEDHKFDVNPESIGVKYGYNLMRTPQEIRDSGYTFKVSCQESVPEAICCFLFSDSYEQTIREAILLRGDTDTQACMAGSIAAAYYGIPENIANEAKERLSQDLYIILSKFSKKYNLPL